MVSVDQMSLFSFILISPAASHLVKQRHGSEMLIEGRAPNEGEVMKMPSLARTLELLAEKGRAGFYEVL